MESHVLCMNVHSSLFHLLIINLKRIVVLGPGGQEEPKVQEHLFSAEAGLSGN